MKLTPVDSFRRVEVKLVSREEPINQYIEFPTQGRNGPPRTSIAYYKL